MLRRRDNNPSGPSHHARMHTLAGAGKGVNTRQPVLALQVGSHLDPGIRRKHRPNEDSILVTQGSVPSTSPSTLPKPFALLIVADGMGGQEATAQQQWTALCRLHHGFFHLGDHHHAPLLATPTSSCMLRSIHRLSRSMGGKAHVPSSQGCSMALMLCKRTAGMQDVTWLFSV
jgi:hypothetical protein